MNFYNKSVINFIVYAVYAICVALLLVDVFHHKHGHFEFEEWFGFYALYGFAAYMVIVNSAKLFRKLVKREEDYYD